MLPTDNSIASASDNPPRVAYGWNEGQRRPRAFESGWDVIHRVSDGRSMLASRNVQMSNFVKGLKQFVVSEDGPTAVEYAVMLALILVACISIVTSLGTTVSGTFSKVNSGMGS
jgi:pilus assembly protein Flp/PilA